MLKVALVGNPNSGKTTLFNALTKAKAHVGNWPGVTVERKEGVVKHDGEDIMVIDLPGIYSLSPYSQEEVLTRNYIYEEVPDVILNIVDATNIERNLYLTSQLLELGKKVVVALNMIDVINQNGEHVNVDKLAKDLGCVVVPISAAKGEGIDELLNDIKNHDNLVVPESIISKNESLFDGTKKITKAVNQILKIANSEKVVYFDAIKMLEEDKVTEQYINTVIDSSKVNKIKEFVESTKAMGTEWDITIADVRYKSLEYIIDDTFTDRVDRTTDTVSDKIDKVLTNRVLAIPIFLGAMYLVFSVTFGAFGSFFLDSADYFVNDVLVNYFDSLLVNVGASPLAISLVTEGIIPGVGMILTFLPQIILLFTFLTILEDSGYMSRAAFIMDNILRRFGLSGKAFVPMLMGFGCSVPAIMATRTLENERDRRMAIILTPFMSCGARLPVYVVFAGIFFPENMTAVVFSLYILGILVAIGSGILLKSTVLKGGDATFIMEMPPYRMPVPRNVIINVWEKVKGYVYKAGTILLAASIVIWVLQNFNTSFQLVTDSENSILGAIGKTIAPIFTPLGFGEWRAAVSLLTGLIAKEAVVSTLSILYSGVDSIEVSNGLASALRENFTPLSAYAYMAFVLLYMPCVVAFATIKREMASWKWTLFTITYQTAVAYIVALVIYQVGSLFV